MFTIKNSVTGCTSIDLNATLGFEPFDYLSCFGDGRYCGQFNTLNWPGSSSELPIAILLMGLYLYFIVLGAFATSDGGKPKYPWLLRSNGWGFWWMLFLVECIHHANAIMQSKTELTVPGSSPFGRLFHHVLDGLCHTTFVLTAGSAFRSAGGKGLPSRALLIGVFFWRMIITENWEYGGISWRLRYLETDDHFDRPEMTLGNYYTPEYATFDPRSHGGKVYWGYSICALLSIAMISGFEPFWKLKSGFIPQLLVILIFDFSPTLYMMVGGANLAPERSYAMHLGHLTSYVCWQTNVFIWNFRGPNKHWMSNYGGGGKSVKAA